MTKVPVLNYDKVIKALRRDGWVVVRRRGSHIRLQKNIGDEILKIIVPAHKPIKRSTLSHILKQARLSVSDCGTSRSPKCGVRKEMKNINCFGDGRADGRADSQCGLRTAGFNFLRPNGPADPDPCRVRSYLPR